MTVNSLDFGRVGVNAQSKLSFPGWEHLISDRVDLGLDIHFKVWTADLRRCLFLFASFARLSDI